MGGKLEENRKLEASFNGDFNVEEKYVFLVRVAARVIVAAIGENPIFEILSPEL